MSQPTKRIKLTQQVTGTDDQQSADFAQHSSGEGSATAMCSSANQAKTEQLEFELTLKTRDEIISILNKYTALLSGVVKADASEEMRKANVILMSTLMDLPVRVDGRSRSFESLERSLGDGWNEVVLYLGFEVRSRIVDTLITNHHVLSEPDSVSSEYKTKLLNQNNALICELIKLRVRTGAITSDSSTPKGDHLIDPATKASESQATGEVNSPPTNLGDLPPKLISELFEYLHPKDLTACSMVNKRWHSIYSNFKVHSLAVIGGFDNCDHLRKWSYPDQKIEDRELCFGNMFVRLAKEPLLSNLKHLALCDLYKFDLNKLNRFKQLVRLQIRTDYSGVKLDLSLPKLEVLAFYGSNKDVLSIDCPLLNTLVFYSSGSLEVKQPETIRKLETDMYRGRLDQFKNVECLLCQDFEVISKDTLLSLPKLREFRYFPDIESLFYLLFYKWSNWSSWSTTIKHYGIVSRVKRTLSEFLEDIKELRGDDFRFSFAGFLLTSTMLDQIDFGPTKKTVRWDGNWVQVENGDEKVYNEYVYMKNYQLIEPGAMDFIDTVDYILLLGHVTGEFPRCFSQKFTSITRVRATAKVQDVDQFLWFLKSLRFLGRLELERTGLSQEFYDQLPASAHSLISLELGWRYCEDGLQVNFDFIGKFSRLSQLRIGPALSVQSHSSLSEWLDKVKKVDYSMID